jgi:hypothetical protein
MKTVTPPSLAECPITAVKNELLLELTVLDAASASLGSADARKE